MYTHISSQMCMCLNTTLFGFVSNHCLWWELVCFHCYKISHCVTVSQQTYPTSCPVFCHYKHCYFELPHRHVQVSSWLHTWQPAQPWLVWLSGLSAGLRTKGSLAQFPVRTHAWVVGQVSSRGARSSHMLMFLSLSFSFPSPSKNK